jgi:hypothetical protein
MFTLPLPRHRHDSALWFELFDTLAFGLQLDFGFHRVNTKRLCNVSAARRLSPATMTICNSSAGRSRTASGVVDLTGSATASKPAPMWGRGKIFNKLSCMPVEVKKGQDPDAELLASSTANQN